MVLEKNGIRICVELKDSLTSNKIAKAIGQLMFSKVVHSPEKTWVVVPPLNRKVAKHWLDVLQRNEIELFVFDQNKLSKVDVDFLESNTRQMLKLDRRSRNRATRCIEIDNMIYRLLKNYRDGLSVGEIAEKIGVCRETVKAHIHGNIGKISKYCILRDEIAIENGKIFMN